MEHVLAVEYDAGKRCGKLLCILEGFALDTAENWYCRDEPPEAGASGNIVRSRAWVTASRDVFGAPACVTNFFGRHADAHRELQERLQNARAQEAQARPNKRKGESSVARVAIAGGLIAGSHSVGRVDTGSGRSAGVRPCASRTQRYFFFFTQRYWALSWQMQTPSHPLVNAVHVLAGGAGK